MAECNFVFVLLAASACVYIGWGLRGMYDKGRQ